MRCQYLFCLLFTSSMFASHSLSYDIGYTSARASFSFAKASSEIQEQMKTIGGMAMRLSYLYEKQQSLYSESSLLGALAVANNASCFFTIQSPQTLKATYSYIPKGYTYGAEQKMGYIVRFGPLCGTPFLGLFLEKTVWNRHHLEATEGTVPRNFP